MQTAERLFFRIPEAIAATGVPRSTLYKLIRQGEIEIVKLGNRTLIPADSLRAWAERLRIRRTEEPRTPIRIVFMDRGTGEERASIVIEGARPDP